MPKHGWPCMAALCTQTLKAGSLPVDRSTLFHCWREWMNAFNYLPRQNYPLLWGNIQPFRIYYRHQVFSKKEARHVIVNQTSLSRRKQTHSQLATQLSLEAASRGQGKWGLILADHKGVGQCVNFSMGIGVQSSQGSVQPGEYKDLESGMSSTNAVCPTQPVLPPTKLTKRNM